MDWFGAVRYDKSLTPAYSKSLTNLYRYFPMWVCLYKNKTFLRHLVHTTKTVYGSELASLTDTVA